MKTISKLCKGMFQNKAVVIAEFETEQQAEEFREKIRYDNDLYAVKSVARNMPGIVSVSHRYV